MSDWDILAPVDNGTAQDEQDFENEGNDGVFFADGGGDNDSFGVGDNIEDDNAADGYGDDFPKNEAQSFNPRMAGDHFKRRDFFRHHGDFDDQQQQQQQFRSVIRPQETKSNPYRDMSHSYTDRKIHDAPVDTFNPKPYKSRRGSNYRGRRRDMSDSDSANAAVPHDLLEGGFDEARYIEFHDAACDQRAQLGIGNSPEMNSLYYFWCYYLREHFDQMMYDEFLETARQDIAGGSHYGIECYFRLCSYGLEQRWDEEVFKQFQDEALADFRRGSTYGLEKVKSFLVHNKYNFPMPVSPEMNTTLEKFPTLESFKFSSSPNKKSPKQSSNNSNNNRVRGRNFNEEYSVTESRSIPKNNFMLGNNQSPTQPQQQRRNRNNNNQANNNDGDNQNRRSRGGNNNNNNQRNRNQNRGGRGGQNAARNLNFRNDEPQGWTFGKMQPSSAPNLDSPMRRNNL
ncbi:hypothetical protein TRFO_23481 [Tritrichomonas foetus]|uniref:Uncharacterized protein n=1 Tax=Tritrichomonas foetus TaxID=1144522 RepID=A0A1J4KFH0_9EUKA|nr:hypothetical protein TRFO_23481 [Tritrichomonas foetus]|eukprot:OHT08117.1 hypothetical protein TRFO_23481 [Tritrichomonas foetus]